MRVDAEITMNEDKILTYIFFGFGRLMKKTGTCVPYWLRSQFEKGCDIHIINLAKCSRCCILGSVQMKR